MENIATKKSSYDLLSSLYKARGKSGASSRNVRAQRASENRQLSRMDEVSKRRRMPLSPLADENVDNEAVTARKNGKPVNILCKNVSSIWEAKRFFLVSCTEMLRLAEII